MLAFLVFVGIILLGMFLLKNQIEIGYKIGCWIDLFNHRVAFFKQSNLAMKFLLLPFFGIATLLAQITVGGLLQKGRAAFANLMVLILMGFVKWFFLFSAKLPFWYLCLTLFVMLSVGWLGSGWIQKWQQTED
ncbi:MAG: hypothetical protein C4K58_07665 [Flavobacteriaceae bacterium]|nr:MAG: hypothetical protein C4K58_07665 [Flavobacteriaceae bacterium]